MRNLSPLASKHAIGQGQIFLTRVDQFLLLGSDLGLGLKISPKNPNFFDFFTFRLKKSILVRSKSTQRKRRIGLLFNAGHKNTKGRVRAHLYSKVRDRQI